MSVPDHIETTRPFEYVVGGRVPADDPSYVTRHADDEIYSAVAERHKLCYLLNSRQMGKTSLCIRASERLRRDKGFVCGWADLQNIVSAETTPEQFSYGFQ